MNDIYTLEIPFIPRNEAGVVCLFALNCTKFGFSIVDIQSQFPDCKVRDSNGNIIGVEFEYKSSSFKNHLTSHKKKLKDCKYIVCWDHNFHKLDIERKFEIIAFNQFKNSLFPTRRVWISCVGKKLHDYIEEETTWSVVKSAKIGDLVLLYKNLPYSHIKDIFVITGKPFYGATSAFYKRRFANIDDGKDYLAKMKRLCELKTGLTYNELQAHPILKNAGYMKKRLNGRSDITVHWPYFYEMIIKRNKNAAKCLKEFKPK